jgi:cyclopropane-fatty-acyl-phospholipid synthase
MPSLLHAFLSRLIRHGSLEVERSTGQRLAVGDGAGRSLAVRFTDKAAERQLMLNPALVFGELFMDGRLVATRGSIYDLLELISRNLETAPPTRLARARDRLRLALRPLHQRNNAWRARRNVAHHYDLDRRLYELFLDSDRQYSCAYFEHPGQSLEEAQLAKKRHIAAKLLIEPGQHVLDIGSGWGGLALYLAEHCGAEVTGITLSDEQLEVAHRRAEERQAAASVSFRLQDYRAVSAQFDRIVSVGMERALRCTATTRARDHRALRAGAPPAIRRLCARHAGIPAAVADAAHPRHVPSSGVDVRPPGAHRGA